ncbi:XdhC family protein [Kineosporia succinea]|uniref:Xanthine dehydrogenase accessory factor n=1 Tax=Kineosporia succinea TaxID=84632 RepID=A0ABT9P664_9ACTN|nr:XdhC family protein [Kineosporia succinea]MDP9827924.1 xanthine dehydrogenase accessory factor [Kineosporia succinea]
MSIQERARDLTNSRTPFVEATVVRAQVPSSARAGDQAVVLTDGTIEGFVGGQCAESSVRTAALGTLENGETLLLRVLPEDLSFPETPGAEVVVNPCLSGGALEIFLRPVLPPPLVRVVGDTPVADHLVRIGEILGYTMVRTSTSTLTSDTPDAVIIASHGHDEEEQIRRATDASVAYVALVASRRRGSAVLDGLGLTDEERERVSTPAGLDIGARTPGEIALSILAEAIPRLRSGRKASNPSTALDPVCGMTVTITPETLHLGDVWFCGEHCRATYAKASAR